MSSYSQRKAIKEFERVTNRDKDVARRCLSQNGWKVEQALDYFFSNPHLFPSSKTGDTNKLQKIFNKYAKETDTPQQLVGDSMFAFFKDVDIDGDKAESLGVCWKLNCADLLVITHDEFLTGFSQMGCDSVSSIKAQLAQMKNDINGDKYRFKPFYRWLFNYVKGDERRKTLDVDVAVNMWELVLTPHWSLTEKWLEFVTEEDTNLKAVSRDLWEQLGDFVTEVGDDITKYDPDTSAWPFQIDMFMEKLKSKNGDDDDDD